MEFDHKNPATWVDDKRYPDMTLQDVVVIQERLCWPWWRRLLTSHQCQKRRMFGSVSR